MSRPSQNELSNPPFKVQVAERVTRLPPYLFGRINSLLYNKRRAGDDVIDLGMGNPSDPPEEFVIEKLAEAARDPRNHGYSKSNGIANLRREVASKYFKRFGVRLDPDEEVIVCLGSKEGFSHMCLAMMGPGDTAIVPAPYFPIHVYSVALASGNVIALEVRDSERFLQNVAYTCEHLYPKPKLLILSFPANPTGQVVDRAFFEKIVEFARENDLMVVHDFAYAEVCFDGYKPPSILEVPGAKEIAIEFTSLSKSHSMAGWRVGFACGNRDMVHALGRIKSYLDYGMPQAIQIGAIVALRGPQDVVAQNAEEYRLRRDALCEGLGHPGEGAWKIEKPLGTMFVWARLPEALRSLGSLEFSKRLLREAHVAVSPGVGFGSSGEGYVRFALIENRHRIRQAVRGIRRFLRDSGVGV